MTNPETGATPLPAVIALPSSGHPMLDLQTQAFLDHASQSGGLHSQIAHAASAKIRLGELQCGQEGPSVIARQVETLPVGPTGSVDICIVRPSDAIGPLPIVMYFHGGCWVMGDHSTHARLLSDFAVGAGVAIVCVDHSHAPAATFPVQNEQAFAAMVHLVQNASDFGLDGRLLAVAGEGTGATIATAVAMMSKRRRGPAILFQMLLCPMTAIPADNESYRFFGVGPGMTSAALKCFVTEQFPGNILNYASAFPMAATIRELAGFPETLVITAENDILRDEGEAYARRLMQAEVAVTATRYLGTVHDFLVLDGLAETPPARAAMAQAIGGLKACFAAAAMPVN